MQTYSPFVNICMFEGYIHKQPEYTAKPLPQHQTLHTISITISQPTGIYIRCIALGNLAIRLKALDLSHDDKVYVHSQFRPHMTEDNRYVMRFIIDKLVVIEKKTSPIPLEYTADNNTYDLLEYLT